MLNLELDVAENTQMLVFACSDVVSVNFGQEGVD